MDTSRADELRAALLDDPCSQHLDERSLLRDAVAHLVGELPGAAQLADLDALLTLVVPDDGLALTEREWVEAVLAADRCISHLHALRLAAVTGLDQRILATRPTTRHRRDSRRPAADALAPPLKIAPGSASALVGLARQAQDMPAASDALADGAMTYGQFQVLARVLARLPDPDARAQVEAIAVRKATTAVRAQLAGILEEAATQADPGFAARTTAMGVEDRDVRLAPSPVPGCQRVIADLERSDAARFWQVLNHVATRAKAAPVLDDATGQVTEEDRTLPQLRADALVSLVVGMFSIMTDEPDEPDEAAPDLPADTRAPVRIPTPADRAKLSELHVVVLADDLDDEQDDGPDDGPPQPGGPGDEPGDEPSDEPSDEPVPPGDRPVPPGARACAGTSPAPGTTAPRLRRPRSLARFRPMGWLPGHGRLDPGTTAAIIDAAPWRRLVADPTTGVLVQRSSWVVAPGDDTAPHDHPPGRRGRRLALLLSLPAQPPPRPEVHYRPSSGLAAFIRARDATCIGPACHHAARSGGMQLDHTTAWGPDTPTRLRGGCTAHGNLGCVCVRTHDAKTHGGWLLAQPRPGSFVWTSPQGLVFRRRATPLVPDVLGDLAA